MMNLKEPPQRPWRQQRQGSPGMAWLCPAMAVNATSQQVPRWGTAEHALGYRPHGHGCKPTRLGMATQQAAPDKRGQCDATWKGWRSRLSSSTRAAKGSPRSSAGLGRWRREVRGPVRLRPKQGRHGVAEHGRHPRRSGSASEVTRVPTREASSQGSSTGPARVASWWHDDMACASAHWAS